MPSQFFGLNIGASALYAYQASLNTTANNIANVKTDGYSRQEAELSSTSPLRVYAKYGSAGTGVEAVSVKQQRDLYYDAKYWENNSSLGYFEQKLYYLSQVETVFSDDGVQEGFSTIFTKMFNGLDSLHGDNASDESYRNQFIYQAQNFCTYFSSVADSLREIQKDCNEEISAEVSNINAIAEKIALLNKEINKLELRGGYANELRDQRALLLDELSSMVNVTTDEYDIKNTYGQDLGGTNFMVYINGQILVDGSDYRQLECVSSETKKNQTDADGLYDLYWSDTKTLFSATSGTSGGTLKALFDLRDGNNNEAMHGVVERISADGKEIVLSNPYNTDINALNIPAEGTITINNKAMKYTGWEAEIEDGKIKNITFTLEEAVTPTEASVMSGKKIEVGKCVDSMGIPYYQQQINEFLRSFVEMFNDIQKEGQTLDGEQMGSFFVAETGTGKVYEFDGWGKTDYQIDANGNITTDPVTKISSTSDGYHQMTAFNVKVNDTSMKNPSYFSTTKDVTNGADATDILDELMTLQKEVTMYRGANAESFLETLISDISVDTEKNKVFYENYYNMQYVIENQRMSISGVDEDEEALNLIKFQNAYNLSAKVISIMNEIYDKLINETGVT